MLTKFCWDFGPSKASGGQTPSWRGCEAAAVCLSELCLSALRCGQKVESAVRAGDVIKLDGQGANSLA